jgi:GNAT superfamily N-acetyltransferase
LSIDIGPVRFGDHDQLREVRLRALGEDPEAFASWLEEERAHPRSWWEELVAEAVAGEVRYLALARTGGRVAGMAGGRLEGGICKVWGMWVEPPSRRRGVARALLHDVTAWGRSRGARRTSLWLNLANEPARLLYLADGFHPTGDRKPMPGHPDVLEERYERPEPPNPQLSRGSGGKSA